MKYTCSQQPRCRHFLYRIVRARRAQQRRRLVSLRDAGLAHALLPRWKEGDLLQRSVLTPIRRPSCHCYTARALPVAGCRPADPLSFFRCPSNPGTPDKNALVLSLFVIDLESHAIFVQLPDHAKPACVRAPRLLGEAGNSRHAQWIENG
jgi:hypothetical protein